MVDLPTLVRRPMSWLFRLPPGAGVLFRPQARRPLVLAVVGSAALAGLEVIALALVVALTQLLTEAEPGTLTQWITRVSGVSDRATLTSYLAGAVIVIYVAKTTFALSLRWWISGVMVREQVAISQRIFDSFLRGPYAVHLRRPQSEILNTMGWCVNAVFSTVIVGVIGVFAELLTIIGVVGTLLVTMPLPTLLLAGYLTLAVAAYVAWSGPRVRRASQLSTRASAEQVRIDLAALSSVREIIVRGGQGYFLRAAESVKLEVGQAGRRMSFLAELPKYLLEMVFIVGIALASMLAFATHSAGDGLAAVALLGVAGFRVLPSVVRVLSTLTGIRSGEEPTRLVVAALHDALALPPASTTPATPLALTSAVEVDRVTFRYPGAGGNVLHDVSLTLPAGTTTALVGSSGAGKTTVVDLVLGLFAPDTGAILVDGVDIHSDLPGWRAALAIAPQQTVLIPGTVRDNVAFAQDRDEVDDAQVRDVLAQAHLDDVVRRLPQGLDALLGPGGSDLSGGERQRLGLARALYRNPALLILDEATSALDNETEHRVTQTVAALHGRLTVLVVAHRLSTVRHADQIVFMDGGDVAATGTFDELRAGHPAFARLVELGSLS